MSVRSGRGDAAGPYLCRTIASHQQTRLVAIFITNSVPLSTPKVNPITFFFSDKCFWVGRNSALQAIN